MTDSRTPVLFCWSGGKDSSMALHALMQSEEHEVVALLTTVTAPYDRVSMHGFRRTLLEVQAASIGLPVEQVLIPAPCSDEEYGAKMTEALGKFHAQGVRTCAFGDLFLEGIRRYREENLAKVGMAPIFPLWGRDTSELVREFIDLGFKAVITCVDTEKLDASFAGRFFDADLLNDLPEGVDPCAENGEFHSFAFDGPIFSNPIAIELGERVLRDGRFQFCDVLPKQ